MNRADRQPMQSTSKLMNRWFIAAMGVALQLCIGTVYAWSYFQNPLAQTYHWSNMQVAWVFSTTIVFLSLGAAVGGRQLPRYGARTLAVLGTLLFGSGYLLGALALQLQSLPLLYLGYGVVGGTGIGLAYVTPVATVAKWFPDKKGLATGMVVMGFGIGAMLMSKLVAPVLMHAMDQNLPQVFGILGLIFLLIAPPIAWTMQEPPQTQSAQQREPAAPSALRSLLFSPRFALIWLLMFCNTVAGIMFIGFQSPMIQELWRRQDPDLSPERLAAYGATLIAVSALFNGLGRFAWGSLSDRLGRVEVFRIMLLTQCVAFVGLGWVASPWIFGIVVCYILLCYGGGFGALPSFVSDAFGAQNMSGVYGAMLTAWGAAGVVGPQLVAYLRDRTPDQASSYAFAIGAGFLLLGFLASFGLKRQDISTKSRR